MSGAEPAGRGANSPTGQPPFAGRYLLVDALGAGGMGTVYRARDQASGRVLALKRLKLPARTRDAALLKALFEREFHTLARLGHPHIVTVHDYGVSGGSPFYTMELIEGQDLQALSPLPSIEACRVLREVASALALLHAHRLVHRDINPRNVRLTAEGHAKLIDFGALAAFGSASELAGTPMCVAPEALRRAPLDQRSDLYALGALAYGLLTGRPPYAARVFADLPEAWRRTLEPPSAVRAEIPAELDRLILSMLDADPQARPSSAGEVIERLGAIAGLADEPALGPAARSYLASGPMLGRESEQELVKRRVQRARENKGCEIVLEGPLGIGRSRLLHELCLDAQLEAVSCLRSDAERGRQPYSVAIDLALQLLDVAPELAREAAGAEAARFADLAPALADKLGLARSGPGRVAAETGPPLSAALAGLFLRAAARTPLVLAIDNFHAADPQSAEFLEAVGRASRSTALIVLMTQRSGSSVRAPAIAGVIHKRSVRIRLRGLDALAYEALAKSLFGDVPNTGRLSRWLRERSAGNPEYGMQLARSLVERGLARYENGTWLLPLEIEPDERPERDANLLAALAGLSPSARALCDALSVYDAPVARADCLSLVPELEERALYAALDELIAEHVLVAHQAEIGFALEPVREAVLAHMPAAERRERHLRAAEAALECAARDHDTPTRESEIESESARERADEPSRRESRGAAQMRAAWHLLAAGERDEGLEWAEEAAAACVREPAGELELRRARRTLQAALAIREQDGQGQQLSAAHLALALVPIAFQLDVPLGLEPRERALRLGLEWSGLALAASLARWLGRRLGAWLGERIARFRLRRARAAPADEVAALQASLIDEVCCSAPAAVGTSFLCGDWDAVEHMTVLLEPLGLLPEGHAGAHALEFARALREVARGHEPGATTRLTRLERRLREPELEHALGPAALDAAVGCVLLHLGRGAAQQAQARALDYARALQARPQRMWGVAADHVRLVYAAARAELAQVETLRERIELAVMTGAPSWHVERIEPFLLLPSELAAHAIVGVRRIFRQLERQVEASESQRSGEPGAARAGTHAADRRASDASSALQQHALQAEAGLLALRHDFARAIALLDRLSLLLRPRRRAGWLEVRLQLGAALLDASQPARAQRVLRDALEQRAPDEPATGAFIELQRLLALAESALGQHAQAAAVLDRLLAQSEQESPVLRGLLHQSRAELALRMRDAGALAWHYAQMERCYRATGHPAWLARGKALRERITRTSLAPGVRPR